MNSAGHCRQSFPKVLQFLILLLISRAVFLSAAAHATHFSPRHVPVKSHSLSETSQYQYRRKKAKDANAPNIEVSTTNSITAHDVIHYKYGTFPSPETPVFDFKCQESNVYATKLPCVVKCRERNCSNAASLCQKLPHCRYVIEKKKSEIAVLKRAASMNELDRLRLTQYPSDMKKLSSWMQDNGYSPLSNLALTTHLPVTKEMKFHGYLYTPSEKKEVNNVAKLLHNLNHSGKVSILHNIAKDFDGDPRFFRHCGLGTSKRHLAYSQWEDDFVNNSISLVVVNMNSPMSFLNSVRSWDEVGLLEMVDERIAILSNSTAAEVAIAIRYGFKIIRPVDIETTFKLDDDIFTLSSAFYFGLQLARNENILFLETDFAADLKLSRSQLSMELIGAIGMLDRGSLLVRLLSRKGMGTYSFQNCDSQKFDDIDRKRNWYTFYCNRDRNMKSAPSKKIRMAGNSCLESPNFKCFTSRDSNWSLNACIVRKSRMIESRYQFILPDKRKRKRKPVDIAKFTSDNKTVSISIPNIGLYFCSHKQDTFESLMIHVAKWQDWKVPLCLSVEGIFLHSRIDPR